MHLPHGPTYSVYNMKIIEDTLLCIAMFWVVPRPRMPVANEDLGWDPLETGGDCYWAGGQPKLG